MPDLDTELRSLRERMLSSIPRPDLDGVAQRSRQRVVRRRTQLGAAVAVLVVAMVVPVLHGQSTRDPGPPADPPGRGSNGGHYDVEFADDNHGFALRDTCAGPTVPDGGCEYQLACEMVAGEAGRGCLGDEVQWFREVGVHEI